MPDDLKCHILTGNEAERYTLIKVEPDIPAASEEEDATVRERQTDAVTALAELDPRQDDGRRQLLEDTLDRLSGRVDLQSVASILHRAVRARKTHEGERMLNKGMAASHVERDTAIRDLRASLARLRRWIQKCTPHWGRDMAFGVVLAAVKRLEQAVTSNAFLSAPTKVLARLHPPAAVGPPRQVWTQDARQQLKTLPLDDGTIEDLLWAVGLVSRHPAEQ